MYGKAAPIYTRSPGLRQFDIDRLHADGGRRQEDAGDDGPFAAKQGSSAGRLGIGVCATLGDGPGAAR